MPKPLLLPKPHNTHTIRCRGAVRFAAQGLLALSLRSPFFLSL